jgi:hypothetical protein
MTAEDRTPGMIAYGMAKAAVYQLVRSGIEGSGILKGDKGMLRRGHGTRNGLDQYYFEREWINPTLLSYTHI